MLQMRSQNEVRAILRRDYGQSQEIQGDELRGVRAPRPDGI